MTVDLDGKMAKEPSADPTDLEKYITNRSGSIEDVGIAELGLQSKTTRDISLIAIIALGWNICNSWSGIAATMALSIASGGSVTLIYGIIVIFVLGGASAASMAELASVYPTAGGQYHWTSILAPKQWSKGLSYWCGAVNTFAWVTTTAGVAIAVPQLIVGLAAFWHPTYVPQRWHVFLIYQALAFIFTAYNIFVIKRTAWIHDVGFFISLVGFLVIFVTCLAIASPKQSDELVWATFENTTGWSSSGIVFLTGLVNPNYLYAGLDGAIHLAEECKNASVAVPKALMSTVFIGFATAFAFAVAMTYSYTDLDAVLASPVPILEIFHQATRSRGVASFFLLIVTACGCFALTGAIQTASRLTWSFARDDALVGSQWLSRIHPKLLVPVWALIANFAVVFVIGCIYLGSTTAFNAMVGTSLILMHMSFAFPAAMLLYRRRSTEVLSDTRSFKLGPFGWVLNTLTIVMAVLVLVFYSFPTVLPVTAGNMNYACAVVGVMSLFTVVNWYVWARNHYHGPRIEFLS